jgi:hypothetical protein
MCNREVALTGCARRMAARRDSALRLVAARCVAAVGKQVGCSAQDRVARRCRAERALPV